MRLVSADDAHAFSASSHQRRIARSKHHLGFPSVANAIFFYSFACALPPNRAIMRGMGAPMDGKNLGGLSILVVDDDDNMRNLICTMIRRMNANILVIEAHSGEEALERISAALEPFNIVICDWEMPRMTGIELFKQVHARDPKLPFLMLTGRTDLESVVAAKKAGITGYLVKPVSPQQLRAKVAVLLRSGE